MTLDGTTPVSRRNLLENANERHVKQFLDTKNQIICIVACIVAVCMDPFFLYIPFLSHTKKCLGMNTNMWLVAVVVRSVADLAYGFGYGGLAADLAINCYTKSFLLYPVYVVALFPIPQFHFSTKSNLRGDMPLANLMLFCHYGTRIVVIFRSCEQLKTRVSVITLERFNALVYIFLYIIVSHVIGASWYYLSIRRQLSCWQQACKLDTRCVDSIFHCDGTTTLTLNSTLVNEFCPIDPPNAAVFDYGIYLDALQSHIVEDKELLKKFLRSFFWGLRHLSSFASNLQTSTNGSETCFAIIISVVALILLIYIIGNIQRYTEMASARSERIVDKMKLIKPKIKLLVERHNLGELTETLLRERLLNALENDKYSITYERMHIIPFLTESLLKDLSILETNILNPKKRIQGNAEKWLSNNNIPPDQNNNILFYLACGLEDDQDVNLESVLSFLPPEHEWITKKHLCFDTLKKVPGLQNIDEEWFKSLSSKLKPVIYPKESYIFREGKSLDFIIFITNGIAWSYPTRTDAGGRVSVSIKSLEKGDFFGEELLQWKLDKRKKMKSDRIPLTCIPISTADVKSHTQVEAFVLMINDLAFSSDFPVATSKLRRIIRKQISNADSATQRVDSSSQTEEGPSVRREIEEEGPSVRREIEEV